MKLPGKAVQSISIKPGCKVKQIWKETELTVSKDKNLILVPSEEETLFQTEETLDLTSPHFKYQVPYLLAYFILLSSWTTEG